jgi:hypothetical protein
VSAGCDSHSLRTELYETRLKLMRRGERSEPSPIAPWLTSTEACSVVACYGAETLLTGRTDPVGSPTIERRGREEWTGSVATDRREITPAGASFSLQRVCPSGSSARLDGAAADVTQSTRQGGDNGSSDTQGG